MTTNDDGFPFDGQTVSLMEVAAWVGLAPIELYVRLMQPVLDMQDRDVTAEVTRNFCECEPHLWLEFGEKEMKDDQDG